MEIWRLVARDRRTDVEAQRGECRGAMQSWRFGGQHRKHIGAALLVGYDASSCGVWPRPPDMRKTPGEVAKRPPPGIFARKLRENVRKLRLSGTSNAVRVMFPHPTDPQRFSGGGCAGRASKISRGPPTTAATTAAACAPGLSPPNPSENDTTPSAHKGPREAPRGRVEMQRGQHLV